MSPQTQKPHWLQTLWSVLMTGHTPSYWEEVKKTHAEWRDVSIQRQMSVGLIPWSPEWGIPDTLLINRDRPELDALFQRVNRLMRERNIDTFEYRTLYFSRQGPFYANYSGYRIYSELGGNDPPYVNRHSLQQNPAMLRFIEATLRELLEGDAPHIARPPRKP